MARVQSNGRVISPFCMFLLGLQPPRPPPLGGSHLQLPSLTSSARQRHETSIHHLAAFPIDLSRSTGDPLLPGKTITPPRDHVTLSGSAHVPQVSLSVPRRPPSVPPMCMRSCPIPGFSSGSDPGQHWLRSPGPSHHSAARRGVYVTIGQPDERSTGYTHPQPPSLLSQPLSTLLCPTLPTW
ncbi:uncharacterized protein BO80DRAFT_123641 [Aspergillus ibericus CBS 121593]|uniref:Uncharacterized protein n=1 Tax=Aspergillus ibericus CBS 121593 TaxID=1448316 RepID=A0A395GVI5_9EURO|nr:hypothetical protein BO80DRAFT_123641 [Aspergillus ibericus CBS 121593]RAK99419.1 hypothetical protein BO80DRAFT_123641 [Aspergillus ibericus CBS 121593]